jgi:hypothetical protein
MLYMIFSEQLTMGGKIFAGKLAGVNGVVDLIFDGNDMVTVKGSISKARNFDLVKKSVVRFILG